MKLTELYRMVSISNRSPASASSTVSELRSRGGLACRSVDVAVDIPRDDPLHLEREQERDDALWQLDEHEEGEDDEQHDGDVEVVALALAARPAGRHAARVAARVARVPQRGYVGRLQLRAAAARAHLRLRLGALTS